MRLMAFDGNSFSAETQDKTRMVKSQPPPKGYKRS